MGHDLAYNKFIQQAMKYGFSLYGPSKTGQIVSYFPNDDGDYQKGYPLTGPRFIDNKDGTITDMATGLMWTKDVADLGSNFWENGLAKQLAFTWAITSCEALNYAGHTDWRCPNIREIFSLVNYKYQNPACDPIFNNIVDTGCWSSTTRIGDTTWAWQVVFTMGTIQQKSKVGAGTCRPVRGGVAA